MADGTPTPESGSQDQKGFLQKRITRRQVLSGIKEVGKGVAAVALVSAIPSVAVGGLAAADAVNRHNAEVTSRKYEEIKNSKEVSLVDKELVPQDSAKKDVRRIVVEDLFPRLGLGDIPNVRGVEFPIAHKLPDFMRQRGTEAEATNRINARHKASFTIGGLDISTRAVYYPGGNTIDEVRVSFTDESGEKINLNFGRDNSDYVGPGYSKNDAYTKPLRKAMPHTLLKAMNDAIVNRSKIAVRESYMVEVQAPSAPKV